MVQKFFSAHFRGERGRKHGGRGVQMPMRCGIFGGLGLQGGGRWDKGRRGGPNGREGKLGGMGRRVGGGGEGGR